MPRVSHSVCDYVHYSLLLSVALEKKNHLISVSLIIVKWYAKIFRKIPFSANDEQNTLQGCQILLKNIFRWGGMGMGRHI